MIEVLEAEGDNLPRGEGDGLLVAPLEDGGGGSRGPDRVNIRPLHILEGGERGVENADIGNVHRPRICPVAGMYGGRPGAELVRVKVGEALGVGGGERVTFPKVSVTAAPGTV